jgi:hypothetical protein
LTGQSRIYHANADTEAFVLLDVRILKHIIVAGGDVRPYDLCEQFLRYVN